MRGNGPGRASQLGPGIGILYLGIRVRELFNHIKNMSSYMWWSFEERVCSDPNHVMGLVFSRIMWLLPFQIIAECLW